MTTRDVIYAVSTWSVSQLSRETKRLTTLQRVNARTAPFFWPLGESHGVTCFFRISLYS
jgi:predicted transcriptional regulator